MGVISLVGLGFSQRSRQEMVNVSPCRYFVLDCVLHCAILWDILYWSVLYCALHRAILWNILYWSVCYTVYGGLGSLCYDVALQCCQEMGLVGVDRIQNV